MTDDSAREIDAICDEAVKLTTQAEGTNPLWQAAYHGAMLMREALSQTDEEMVERVGKVLADKFEWTDRDKPDLVYWREIARAAREAMRG